MKSKLRLITIVSLLVNLLTSFGANVPGFLTTHIPNQQSQSTDISSLPSYGMDRHDAGYGWASRSSAFTRDEALVDGRRRLTISAIPMHYRANDGSWQPIDSRFTATENGFTNFTNALSISTADRMAT